MQLNGYTPTSLLTLKSGKCRYFFVPLWKQRTKNNPLRPPTDGLNSNIMRTIYLVETKNYYKDENGIDRQIADGGDLPTLSTSKRTAIDFAKLLEKSNIEDYGYKLVIPDSEYPCKQPYCLYAVRLEKTDRRLRNEIRVYKTYTI